jgi:flagellar assembly protein FliH
MDGEMFAQAGSSGFAADALQPPAAFLPQPGLTLPEGHGRFHPREPSARALAEQARRSAPPDPEPEPPLETPLPPAPQEPLMPRPSAPSPASLAEARAAAFSEGYALGRAEAAAEWGAERAAVTEQARVLALAITRLSDPPAAEVDALALTLGKVVQRLASERAGHAIDAAPAAFARRISRMAERIAQGMREVAIHLHPDDLEALRPLLENTAAPDLSALATSRLVADHGLSRGDVDLRAPGVRVAELMSASDPDPEPHPTAKVAAS